MPTLEIYDAASASAVGMKTLKVERVRGIAYSLMTDPACRASGSEDGREGRGREWAFKIIPAR